MAMVTAMAMVTTQKIILDLLMDNLRVRATKAMLWDLLGNYGGQLTAFILSIFLARLLSPEEFGLVGMSLVFIGMLEIFKDFGFGSALIQSNQNTSLTYSSVFYFSVLSGIVFTVLIFLSAPLIADFFNRSEIVILVQLLSVTFFISSLNIVQLTILRKRLDFKIITLRNLTSQVISGLVAVVLAFNGFGVYSLVVQQLLSAIIATILLWKLSDWKPTMEFSFKELKKLTSFSLYVFLANSVDRMLHQFDTVVIGKLFTPTTLGYYTRANSLNRMVIINSSRSISRIFYPTLAEIKSDPERFEKIYLKVINVVSSIAIFLTGLFYLIGEELIIGLFGLKWKASVPIFQVVILKGFTFPLSAMVINAFLAKGMSKENFHLGNVRKVLQLIPFVFAYYFGFYAFLYAIVGTSFLSWLLNFIFAKKLLTIKLKTQLGAVVPYLVGVSLIILGISNILPQKFSYLWAAIKMLIFIISYFVLLLVIKAPVLIEGLSLLKNLNKSKSKKNGS